MKKITQQEREQKIKEFKVKHRLNIFIDREGEFHFYGTPEDRQLLMEKYYNNKSKTN